MLTQFDPGGDITIGKYCSVADDLMVLNGGEHFTDRASTFPFKPRGIPSSVPYGYTRGDVVIGNDVWIGARVTILSGVTVGDGAVIGACSLVTRDVPPYSIAAGNPARVLRVRFDFATIDKMLALKWWDWPDERVAEYADLLQGDPAELLAASAEFLAARD